MKSLRQTHITKLSRDNEIISDAALKWLNNNVILINEKIDRKTVSRLIDNIQKFDDTFGPYKDKLPTIANYLNAAENGLRLVITGQTTDKKTSNMLEQLTYLYSTFSDFFTRDLPVLLKTNIFDSAKENPDSRLSQLRIQSAGKFDTNLVRDALANALRPSKEERKLLGRIYRSTTLPKLNVEAIANEMLGLTYNDLEELANIGKVPMAVAHTASEAEEQIGAETETPMEAINHSNSGKRVLGEEKYVSEEIAEEVLKRAIKMSRLDEQLVTEVKLLMEANMEEIRPAIGAIKGVVDKVEALEPLRGPINDLQSKVLEVLADGNVKAYLAQATQSQNPASFLKNLFATPKGKILAQANMAIETLKTIPKAWNNIRPFVEKEQPTRKDVVNIKKILTKAVTGGIVGKLASMFKTQPFPGLTPGDIVDALSKPLDEYAEQAQFFGEAKENSLKEQEEGQQPQKPDALAALEKFKTGMQQLVSAVTAGGGSTPTAAAPKPTPSTAPEETGKAGATAPSKETGKKQPVGAKTTVAAPEETVKNISTAFKGKLKPQQVSQLAKILDKQGYKVVKT